MYSLRVASAQRALAGGRLDDVRVAFQELETEPVSPELISVLCSALGSATWSVRKMAGTRLIKIGADALPAIDELLSVGNADQIYWACQVLARVEPSPAPRLQMMLQRSDVNHRRFALHALERRPSQDAVDGLVLALDDPSWEIRKRAAQALHPRLDEESLLQLVRSDHMRATRNRVYWSVQLLCRRMGASVIPIIMKLLPWEDDDLRHLVISTMATLRVDGVAGLLARYVGDRSLLIRREVLQHLIAMGDDALPSVEAAYDAAADDTSKLALLRVLASVNVDSFMRRCRELRSSRRVEDRYLVLEAVTATRSPEAIAMALSLFKDPLQALRGYASDTLAGLGDASISALMSVADGHDHDMKFWAIHTLGRMGQAGLDAMRRMLEHQDFETRALILQAFANIELPDYFLPVLLTLFSDAHWPFRRQAADCLVARGTEAARILIGPALGPEGDVRFWARKVLGDLRLPHIPDWLHRLEGLPHDTLTSALIAVSAAAPERLAAWLQASPEQAMPDVQAAYLEVLARGVPAPAQPVSHASSFVAGHSEAAPEPAPEELDYFDRPINLGDDLIIPAPVRTRSRFTEKNPPRFVLSSLAKGETEIAPNPTDVTIGGNGIPAARLPSGKYATLLLSSPGVLSTTETSAGAGGPVTSAGAAPSGAISRPGAAAPSGAIPRPGAAAPSGAISRPGAAALSGAISRPGAATTSGAIPRTSASTTSGAFSRAGLVPEPARPAEPADPGAPLDPLRYLAKLLESLSAPGASELHLKSGARPVARMVERMVTLDSDPLDPALLETLADMLGASGQVVQRCSDVPGAGRCRVRVVREARGIALVVRPLPDVPPTFDDIAAEPQLQSLRKDSKGLILISGGAESGRTATVAALLGAINVSRSVRITSIESPVEHIHYPHPGLISLVSVPEQFATHYQALHHTLGRGAEVVALDDVPDNATAMLAMEAATSAVVVVVLRARGAIDAIEQFAGLVGGGHRALPRIAQVFRASICQQLLPHATDRRFVAARELLMGTDSVTSPLSANRLNDLRDRLALRGSSVVRSMAEAVSDLRRKGLVARKGG